MATPRVAWGIDIGNRALKAVKLSRSGEGVRIDDYDVIEHENILSNAGDNREALIQTALAVFQGKHNLKGMPAAVGVSGQASFARFIKLPPVEEKKIPEIVRFEAIQQIPFPLDEVEWSYQLFRDEASPDVEVGIFAMRKELVNQHLAYFTQSGVNVQVVQMNPLAVYNALAYDQRIKGATMIIDLGAENADLIIAEGEGVWMRSIPIGGNHFTEALTRDFKLRFERAEELKRTTATSPHGRRILQAMRPVFADLVSELQRSIGFYSSTHRDSRIARVVALGGTFKLPGLQKYLQQNLGLEVAKLDGLGTSPPADAKVATALNENLLSSVSAYGLALQALGEARITSSLLPQAIRKERMWAEKTKWFAAAAACFVVGAAIPFGVSQAEGGSFGQQATVQSQIDGTISQATELSTKWQAAQAAGGDDRGKVVEINTLTEARDVWPELIAEVKGVVPEPAIELVVPTTRPAPTRAAPATVPGARGATKPAAGPATKDSKRGQRTDIRLEDLEVEYLPSMGSLVAKNPTGEFTMLDSLFNGRVGKRDRASLAGQRSRRGQATAGGQFGGGGGYNPEFSPQPFTPTPTGGGGEGGAPVDPNAPAVPGGQKRGFLLTLHLTTPNAGGFNHVTKEVVGNLLAREKNREAILEAAKKKLAETGATGPLPKFAYSIARVTIPSAQRIRDDRERQQALAARAREAEARRLKAQPTQLSVDGVTGAAANINIRGMTLDEGGMAQPGYPGVTMPPVGLPPGIGVGGVPAGVGAEDPELVKLLVDPVTQEDIRDDWEVTVLVAVVLDPQADPPPAAGLPVEGAAMEGATPPPEQ